MSITAYPDHLADEANWSGSSLFPNAGRLRDKQDQG